MRITIRFDNKGDEKIIERLKARIELKKQVYPRARITMETEIKALLKKALEIKSEK